MAGILEMEFSGRGNGWTEVKDRLRVPGISWHRGFPGSRILDCVADAGTMNFSLDNSERNSVGLVGYYSPDNANVRAGFKLNIGVRYRIGSVVRFTGIMDAIDPVPGKNGPRIVQCEAVDWMDVAQRTRLDNLPVQVNKRGDEVFQTLIDSLPIISQPDGVEKDVSSDTFPYTLDRTRDEQTVLRDEIYRLVLSGLDRCWVRGNGTVVYESRTRRATTTSSVDTFTDSNGFMAKRDRTGVINRVQSTVHPRVPGASLTSVLYALNTSMPIVPGQPVTILGPWTDPNNPGVRVGAVSLTSLVSGVDYILNTASDGSGTNITANVVVSVGLSGNATEFTLTLGGTLSGYIVTLQQRGRPLLDYGPSVLQWEDDVSIQQFGLVVQPLDMAYQADPNFGLEAAQYVVFTTANPVTQISGLMRYVDLEHDPTELARSIDREVSDRVGLSDVVTGVNRSFFINAIDESEIDGVLKTEFLLMPADSTAFWLLEVVGRSELDSTTRLGFGLIVGHTDVAHGDSHEDTAHVDVAHTDTAHDDSAHGDGAHSDSGHSDVAHVDVAHSDVAHGDATHSDTHGDTAHVDSHSDVAHSDVAHADSHTDYHGDHNDVAGHGDAHVDGWTHYDSAHSDTAHTDVAHGDGHNDYHFDHFDAGHIDQHADHNDGSGHDDAHNDGSGFDQHGDAHTDSAHSDVAHVDVAHSDYNHEDVHFDTAHADSHNDSAHADNHGDTAHVDAHDDSSHLDTAHGDTDHSDVAHVDVAHSDAAHLDTAHGDVAHGDVNHSDAVHTDSHTDTAHGDVN